MVVNIESTMIKFDASINGILRYIDPLGGILNMVVYTKICQLHDENFKQFTSPKFNTFLSFPISIRKFNNFAKIQLSEIVIKVGKEKIVIEYKKIL